MQGERRHMEGLRALVRAVGRRFGAVPLLGWLVAVLVAVAVEQWAGAAIARVLGLPKIPVLFFLTVLKEPHLAPNTVAYVLLTYAAPVALVALAAGPLANAVAARLMRLPLAVSAALHLAVRYGALHYWAELSEYRLLMLKLTLIGIVLTFSLNLK